MHTQDTVIIREDMANRKLVLFAYCIRESRNAVFSGDLIVHDKHPAPLFNLIMHKVQVILLIIADIIIIIFI